MKISQSTALVVLLGVISAAPLSAQFRTESYQGNNVVAGEVLVRFRGASLAQSQSLAAQDPDILQSEPVGQRGTVVLRSRTRDVAALLQAYRSRLDIEFAEPNYVWTADDTPNDSFFSQQWGLLNTGQSIQGITGTASTDIKTTQAWNITEGSKNIVVGVIDTGVDYTHPDLVSNIWSAPASFTVRINGRDIQCPAGTHGFNAITRNCDPFDDVGHGTHVAGILGASGNNGLGVSGVSRVASIMPIKFLGPDGGTTIDAIAAIDFALQIKAIFPAEANIRLTNNSWGGGSLSQSLLEEIRLLDNADILFVASAGNASLNNDLSSVYPANYDSPNVLSVAATDNRDSLASFSNWGPTSVDIGAPGVNILSTIPGGLYGFLSGTSMAAPMVTGTAALVLSACPMTTSGLKADLMSSADEIPSFLGRILTSGRLNANRAILNCIGSGSPGFSLTVSPGSVNLDPGGSANLAVTAAALQGFSGAINLSAFNLPSGLTATFSPPTISGSGTSTLTVGVSGTAPLGRYAVTIAGNSGNLERRTGATVDLGPQFGTINLNQTISGSLSRTDRLSQERIGSYADFYRLTLGPTTSVTIDLKSGLFDTSLFLLSSNGGVLFFSDNAVSFNSRITTTLPSGSYIIEVASSVDGWVGPYTLSINTPTISSISPRVIPPGNTAPVVFTGTRFTSPLTISAGNGITISNLTVLSSTSASATVSVDTDAAPGPRELTITTAEGVSNPTAFPVPTKLQLGQSLSGSVSTTDLLWPNTLFRYTDLYQLTLTATTSITIDVRSSGFDALIGVFSSTGAFLLQDSDSAGINADRVNTTLAAGTYYIEVTSVVPGNTQGNYEISVNRPGLSSITPRFIEAGTSVEIQLIGSRFADPMTVNAGAGLAFSDVEVITPSVAFATATASGGAAIGSRDITATTPVGSTNTAPIVVVPPIPTVILGTTITGALSESDPVSPDLPNAYMDMYRFSLSSATRLSIDLLADAFDSFIIVMDEDGRVLTAANDSNGTRNASLTATFGSGNYLIAATSFIDRQIGDYTLSVKPTAVGLTSITPRFGGVGMTVTANLTGVGFASPMTVYPGIGITVSNLVVNSSTSATATLTIAPNAPRGTRDFTVTTPNGSGAPFKFTVYTISPIALSETRTASLSITDQGSIYEVGNYTNLYQLTLTGPTSLAITMNSTQVDSFLNVISSTGALLDSDDSSGGGDNAKINISLGTGTYFIEATSAVAGIGNYTLTIGIDPTTLNFPRAVTPTELALTGFAIVNPGPTDAAVLFTMYDSSGAVVSSATQTVPARGQFAKLGTEILSGVNRSGWIQTTSNTPGLQAFWMGGDFVNVMDGAAAAPKALELLFPLITAQTELNVANLGVGSNLLFISAYNVNGTVVGQTVRLLPEKGVLRSTIDGLFPNLTTATSIRIAGSREIGGTSIISDFPVGPSISVLNGADTENAPTTAYFPHVVSGDGWTSFLGVTNVSTTTTQSVLMSFTPASGQAIFVIRSLAPRATLRESVQSLFGLSGTQEGWVRVVGLATITAYVSYGYTGSGGATIVPGQSTPQSTMLFEHVATGPEWRTGIALLNPSTSIDALVKVYVLRKSGSLVGQTTIGVPRGTKISRLITELLPASNANDGFVYIESNIPIFGMQLFSSPDLRVISNIPPGILETGIEYVPPTQ